MQQPFDTASQWPPLEFIVLYSSMQLKASHATHATHTAQHSSCNSTEAAQSNSLKQITVNATQCSSQIS